jgi:hypothetical protein
LWWSSPLSGPRRYEYNDSKKKWVYSRGPDDNLFNVETSHDNKCDTLDGILETEIRTIYGIQIDIDV